MWFHFCKIEIKNHEKSCFSSFFDELLFNFSRFMLRFDSCYMVISVKSLCQMTGIAWGNG